MHFPCPSLGPLLNWFLDFQNLKFIPSLWFVTFSPLTHLKTTFFVENVIFFGVNHNHKSLIDVDGRGILILL